MRGSQELRSFIIGRIEEARLLAGYNTVEMARQLHMARPTYAKLEAGDTVFIDVTLLIQIADVTGRRLSFFLPDADVPDLASSMKAHHPYLSPHQVKDALDYVASLAALSQRKRTLRNELDELSSGRSGDTSGSPPNQSPT